MKRLILVCAAALLPICLAGQENGGTSPLNRPITEADLLNSVNGLGPATVRQTNPGPRLGGSRTEEDKAMEPKPKGATEITALEATFVQKANQAVFIGSVVVRDPEFNLTCDKLTAILKGEDKNAKAASVNGPSAGNGSSAGAKPEGDAGASKGAKGGGLKRAIAESNGKNLVVITQDKVKEDGSVEKNVGRAKRAVYEADSGVITLFGRPEVSQGINTCVALSEETVMTLNRNGQMDVKGPHKTIIRDNSSDSAR